MGPITTPPTAVWHTRGIDYKTDQLTETLSWRCPRARYSGHFWQEIAVLRYARLCAPRSYQHIPLFPDHNDAEDQRAAYKVYKGPAATSAVASCGRCKTILEERARRRAKAPSERGGLYRYW
ncbi:unnamed protein product [Peniophora sp. CBMAI 1063]|nr:unnamed protein product [Peniophora sp. CBMAI 1063]